MSEATRPRATTAICGYDADHIEVRGKDLITDLMGRRTFTEALLLQALGEEPSPRRLQIVAKI